MSAALSAPSLLMTVCCCHYGLFCLKDDAACDAGRLSAAYCLGDRLVACSDAQSAVCFGASRPAVSVRHPEVFPCVCFAAASCL